LNIYSHSTAGVSVSNEFGEIVVVVSPHPARVQTGRNKKKSENRRDVMCRRLTYFFLFLFPVYAHSSSVTAALRLLLVPRRDDEGNALGEKEGGEDECNPSSVSHQQSFRKPSAIGEYISIYPSCRNQDLIHMLMLDGARRGSFGTRVYVTRHPLKTAAAAANGCGKVLYFSFLDILIFELSAGIEMRLRR
jgi:hypothetical protein